MSYVNSSNKIVRSINSKKNGIPRCGGLDHAALTRPCALNDTYCGEWNMTTRYWSPLGCQYQDITREQAIQCIGNRSLAFIGDSQIRSLGVSLAYFLLGETL